MLTVARSSGEITTLVIDWPLAKPASKREGGLGAKGVCLLLFTSARDALDCTLAFGGGVKEFL